MTRGRTKLASIQRRLPRGATLPSALVTLDAALARSTAGALGHFSLGAASTKGLVDPPGDRRARLVPFARLPCGDVLALWWEDDVAEAPRVVHVGAHGEPPRVFASADAFLAGLASARTGAPDLDEGDASPAARRAALGGKLSRAQAPSAALARRFERWAARPAPAAKARPSELEGLRAALARSVLAEVARLPKSYRWVRGDVFATWRLTLDRTRGTVTWPAAGAFVPFPVPDGPRLLEAIARGTGLRGTKVVVTVASDGTVFAGGAPLAPAPRRR